MQPCQSNCTKLPIPVSCVQAGRWRYRAPPFASGGTMGHGLLRTQLCRQVHEGYRNTGKPACDQGAVWQEITRKLKAIGTGSASQELHQAYAAHEYHGKTRGRARLFPAWGRRSFLARATPGP